MAEKKQVTLTFDAATPWKIATVILGILFIVSIVTNGFSGAESPTIERDTGTAPQPELLQRAEIDIDDDAILGDKDAPITMISCEDYQCPFCKRAFEQTFPMIKQNYIDTGKVRYVFRDFPLPFHTEADEAAMAAECAGDQNKYFEMHELLFKNQQDWSGNPKATFTFKTYADQLGLNKEKFDACVDNREHDAEIQKDMAACEAAGTSGTPTFFINGQQVVGAQPYTAFQTALEQALAE
ncbi:MAG: thioredoxin domain-containing protein [Nanoarchaeota archaeon]